MEEVILLETVLGKFLDVLCKKVGFLAMTRTQKFQNFVVNGNYIIHAQGFTEPVTGKIVDIDIADDGEALLVIKKDDDPNPVSIFVRAVSGWTEVIKAA